MQHELRPDADLKEPGPPEVAVPAGALLGWRFEPLSARPVVMHDGPRTKPVHQIRLPSKSSTAWVPFAGFDAEGRTQAATCERRYRLPQHPSLRIPHRTPDPRCSCGYRVVPDLGSLVEYIRYSERSLREPEWSRRTRLGPLAIYRVLGFGVVLDSGVGFDDPPASARVSHLRLAGTILLPASGKGREVARALGHFGCATDVRHYRGLDEVTEMAS